MSDKLQPMQVLRNQLLSPEMSAQFKMALPEHITPEKFVRTAITVLNQSPELLKADRTSLFAALMSSASLGLMPESFLGECYFIPYKNQVQLQIGYKGLLKLARNTGEIRAIESGVIHENDDWSYQEGDDGHFWVKPNFVSDRGAPIIVWCVIRLTSGEVQRELMSAADVEAIRKQSNSANSPAWKNHWASMARKVVIKRALKYAPSSTELLLAAAIDDAPESGAVVQVDKTGHVDLIAASDKPAATPAQTGSKRASNNALEELADEHLSKHVEGEDDVEEGSFHDEEGDGLAEGTA